MATLYGRPRCARRLRHAAHPYVPAVRLDHDWTDPDPLPGLRGGRGASFPAVGFTPAYPWLCAGSQGRRVGRAVPVYDPYGGPVHSHRTDWERGDGLGT